MAIHVIKEPDVHVSADELARYRADYDRDFMFYSGSPPTFENYVRRRKGEGVTVWPR